MLNLKLVVKELIGIMVIDGDVVRLTSSSIQLEILKLFLIKCREIVLGIAVSSTTTSENTDETGTAWTTVPKDDNTDTASTRIFVPLQFWFCRNPGLALPLIALQYHEVKVKISFENLINLARQGVDLV